MLAVHETEFNGRHGKEITFYTGEDVGKNIFLGDNRQSVERIHKFLIESGPGLGANLAFGANNTIDAINSTLFNVYETHRICLSQPHLKKPEEIFAASQAFPKYQLGIQELVYLLNKLCSALMFLKADKIIPPNGEMPSQLRQLLDPNYQNPCKNDIIKALFPREDSIQLFRIIEEVNSIFHSCFMFAFFMRIGTQSPTICAYNPVRSPDSAFTIHNHSVWQIIKGMNTALSDLNLL